MPPTPLTGRNLNEKRGGGEGREGVGRLRKRIDRENRVILSASAPTTLGGREEIIEFRFPISNNYPSCPTSFKNGGCSIK